MFPTRRLDSLGLLAASFLLGCSSDISGPTPQVSALSPAVVCNEQLTTAISITGDGFAPLPFDTLTDDAKLAIPDVTLRRTQDIGGTPVSDAAITLPNDPLAPGGARVRWIDAMHMAFDVYPELGLQAGVYEVTVTNRNGEASILDVGLVAVDRPSITSVVPDLACVAQGPRDVTLSGDGFLQIGNALPTVDFGGVVLPVASLGDCTAVPGPAQVSVCKTAQVTLPEDALAPGAPALVMTNPEPANCASMDAPPITMAVVPPPMITSVEPPAICATQGGDQSITLHGAGFIQVTGVLPTVTIGTGTFTPTQIDGCAAIAGTLLDAQSCTSLTIVVPDMTLPVGLHDLSVTNPDPAGCTSEEPITIGAGAVPSITGVNPSQVCSGPGTTTTISVLGSDFLPTTGVSVGGMPAASVTFVSSTELTVELPAGLPPGTYDVTVTNSGCGSDTLVGGLVVIGQPSVYYVDPPVVYSGIAIEATLYVSGVSSVIDVRIAPAGTMTFTSLSFTYDGVGDPNRVYAIVPSGLTTGFYDVYVDSGAGCSAALPDGFFVESSLTVTVTSVTPPFGATGADVPVEIDGAGFVDVPRVYLSDPSAVTATLLSSTRFQSPTLLSAVVPQGTPTAVYDVLVVNPDGTIGLCTACYTSTATPPPVIDSVTPGRLGCSSNGTITINGTGFATGGVTLECDSYGGGGLTTLTGTITSTGASQIVATAPTSTLGGGCPWLCSVRVTNTDGTFGDFFSISVNDGPLQDFLTVDPGPPLNVARRGPAVTSGRATRLERYVYAIGGDDGAGVTADGRPGATTTVHASVEAASISGRAVVGSWAQLPANALPTPTTMAGVAVLDNRFIYVVGGYDGTALAATHAVHRAQVLDPLEAPRFDQLAMDYGGGANLPGGRWIYRISAIYPSTYATNPGGESLASDPIVVYVPPVPETIVLTLQWTAVANASGYRIYRTPMADGASGSERLLAEVAGGDTLTFPDDGTGTIDPATQPLPAGSLGAWYAAPDMANSRISPLVGVAEDPATPGLWYLYAAGGRDASGVRSDIEILDITVVDDQTQTVGTWATSGRTLPSPRWQSGAWQASDALHSVIPAGDTYVYFGGGHNGAAWNGAQAAGRAGAGGDFPVAEWYDSASGELLVTDKTIFGYGAGAASNLLYTFGGQNDGGTLADEINFTRICGAGIPCGTSAPDPPDLTSWDVSNNFLIEARYLLGVAQESAVFVIVGGETSTAAASVTTEVIPF